MGDTKRHVENTIPVLPVKDIERSIEFYTEKLGFTEDWRGDVTASVSRDGKPIMLSQGAGSGSVSWVWIGMEDDGLFEVFRSNGVKVFQEPANHSWAYEMKFEDPDGNVLWLGTEPKKDLPFDD